jgi:hypothetical protein
MRVTSWIGLLEVVDGGKGVTSGLESSSVDVSDVESSVEVADSADEVEEEASPSSVIEVDSEGPEIVLTTVVTTFVLVWLPDASEILMVLTKVVTISALDWLVDVFEMVVVEVLLDRLPDLKAVELVWLLPLPLLLADTVTRAVVVLLWLDAVVMIGVVELLLLEDTPTLAEREGEVDTCGWLEFVVEVRDGKTRSLPLLMIETPDSGLSELDVMDVDELALELAETVLPVLVKAELEVNTVVDDKLELDPLRAVLEVVTCVPEAVPEDAVEIETAEMFVPAVCVPVTIVFWVALLEVDATTVWLEPDVWVPGLVGVLEEETLLWVVPISCSFGVELLPLVPTVPCPIVVFVVPAPSVVDIVWDWALLCELDSWLLLPVDPVLLVTLSEADELDPPAVVASRLLLELELPDCDALENVPVEELKEPEPADTLPPVCPTVPESVTVLTVPLTCTAAKVVFPTPPEVVKLPLLLEAPGTEVFSKREEVEDGKPTGT